MKISWKRAFYVGGFLALLCGVLGLAIAGGDLLTKETIASNKIKKETEGLRKVFGDNCAYGEAVAVKDENYPYISKYWTVRNENQDLGRVYAVSGSNAYGDVSLLVGITNDYSLGNVVTLENTESYAATLEDGYLIPYGKASDKEKAVEEVKCGATYGAKLCRDMIRSAQSHYKEGGKHE